MAVLEAFVYDPLINWRLMQADPETRPPDGMFLVSPAVVPPSTNPCDCTAELRSQELTRVTGYPQGPLRKLKTDENDIFNGGTITSRYKSDRVIDDPSLCFQRPKNRGMNVRLRYITECRTNLQVRTMRRSRWRSRSFRSPKTRLWLIRLPGRDFNPDVVLTVPMQVEKLILQATSLENLCQCFSGWCAFW